MVEAPAKGVVRRSRRGEIAERAIKERRVSLLLVLEMSRVSQACFRCESKTNAENEQIAH